MTPNEDHSIDQEVGLHFHLQLWDEISSSFGTNLLCMRKWKGKSQNEHHAN